jgi:hypothetical protein
MSSVWIVRSGEDDFVHETIPVEADIENILRRYFDLDDGDFITVKCKTEPDLQSIVVGQPCHKDDNPNPHCEVFTGTIMLCWNNTSPVETPEQGRQRVISVLQNLSELSIDTDDITQTVWVYAADPTVPPTCHKLFRHDGAISTQCIAMLHTSDECQIHVGLEPTTNTPMLMIGTTHNDNDTVPENQWVRGLYGPVVITGGTMDADTKHVQYHSISDTVVRAYVAHLMSHPITQTSMEPHEDA